jgi:hypothetical protein
VVNQSLVLRINICGENRHPRQARKRWGQCRKKKKHKSQYIIMTSRKLIFSLLSLLLFIWGNAQVSKTVHVTTPGTLSTLLTQIELITITDLTLTGDIDARDFMTMKMKMPILQNLSIELVNIFHYKGNEGTQSTGYSESIIEYPANEIPKYCFNNYYSWPSSGKSSLKSIVFPNNITSVGEAAFFMCTNLSGALNLPNQLISIEPFAFCYTSYSGGLNIPNTVKKIGSSAFCGCKSFTGSLIIPSSVTSIGGDAFRYCSGFDGDLILPDSISAIYRATFGECTGFKGSLRIPEKVKVIGSGAFYGCTGFDKYLILNDSIQTIESSAFGGCNGFIGSLTIPSSVTTIGEAAFSGCSGFNGNLTLSPSMTTIDISTFSGCSGFIGSLNIPTSIKSIQRNAFYNCKSFNGTLTIPSSVTWIEFYAFYGCSGFTGSLTIPSSIHRIDNYVFYGCSGFNGNLNLPPTIYSIGTAAFSGCSGFTGSLKIPEFVQEYGAMIGDYAFAGCSGFNDSLILPIKVPFIIGNSSFYGCSGLTGSLVLTEATKSIGIAAFSGCSGFNQALTISSQIKTISEAAFKDCIGLKEVSNIPSGITTIGNYAFMNCTGLLKINTYSNTPSNIVLGEGVFFGINKTTCKLNAPKTKSALYSEAPQWKKFLNINEGVPVTLTTGILSSIYSTNPTGTGQITNLDTNDPTLYGVLWSTNPNPIKDISSQLEKGLINATGPFNYNLTNLNSNTKYYVKAYATNSTGTSYGEEMTFTSPLPVLSAPSVNTLSGFKTVKGTVSSIQTFMISGFELADNIIVTAPIGFEVRQLYNSSFASSISLYNASGVVKNRTIEVRISASSPVSGNVSGNIVCSTTWAESQKIAVSGEIMMKQLTVTAPTIVTNKMVDGNTNAVITKLGTLQGVDASDIGNVGIAATATYNNAAVGINKTITVVYTLTGSAKDKYIAPENYVISNAKISDFVTLNTLTKPAAACEGDALGVDYSIKAGTPTHYKVTFNTEALNAGLKNVSYTALPTSDNIGTLVIPIAANTKDGTYTGTLKMKNELNSESPDYSFEFVVNVSENLIRTKFDDIILFNNADKRFVAYQWLMNGIEIPGATKQFYQSPVGLIGMYSVKLTTTDGKIVYTCPKVLFLFSAKAQVRVTPNPVKVNEVCKIEFSDFTDEQLKKANLAVYTMQGACVYKSNAVESITELQLPDHGAYIGKVSGAGNDYVFKIMVTK